MAGFDSNEVVFGRVVPYGTYKGSAGATAECQSKPVRAISGVRLTKAGFSDFLGRRELIPEGWPRHPCLEPPKKALNPILI